MGSTGTGSLSDYSNYKSSNPNDETGGSSGVDKCDKAFSTKLEDVERCQYFILHGNVPVKGTKIRIQLNKRITAQTLDGNDIGYLPTKYNYIKLCLENGYEYTGEVSSSADSPIHVVIIDVIPTHV